MSQLSTGFETNHVLNEPYLDSNYKAEYDKVMKSDLCPT
jgi:hypothetical protein